MPDLRFSMRADGPAVGRKRPRTRGNIVELNVLGFIVAVIASVLLIGMAEGLSSRRGAARRNL